MRDTVECPKCGAANRRGARRCRCGCVLSRADPIGLKVALPILGAIVVAMALWGYRAWREGNCGWEPMLAYMGIGAFFVLLKLFVRNR